MKTFIFILMLFLNHNILSQVQNTDTLFINYDKKYLEITKFHKSLGKQYFSLKQDKNHQSDDWFYFSEEKIFLNLKPDRIFNIIKVLKKANAYYDKEKFNDWAFYEYLDEKYATIFLVDKSKFIQVEINYFIE